MRGLREPKAAHSIYVFITQTDIKAFEKELLL